VGEDQTKVTGTQPNSMAYGRRNFTAYQSSKNKRSGGSNLQTKVIVFAVVTIVYTAFLYRSGRGNDFTQLLTVIC